MKGRNKAKTQRNTARKKEGKTLFEKGTKQRNTDRKKERKKE